MSKDMVLSIPQFEKLAKDLQRLVDEGRDKAKAANNAIFLKTCWAMGGRIEVEDLSENAGYATTVMERLAKPLKTDRTTLVRCVQFYRAYPKGAPDTVLTWSHYRLCYAQHNLTYVGLALMLASLPPLTALFSFYTT
jgi:hypothetical protein